MIVVRLIGGLGNQMFQYAAAKSLAHHHNTELFLDLTFLSKSPEGAYTKRKFELNEFNIDAKIADNDILQKFDLDAGKLITKIKSTVPNLFKTLVYNEYGYDFNSLFFKLPQNTYLNGYWQNQSYFLSQQADLIKDFELKNKPGLDYQYFLDQITTAHSVAIHVRRGDYATLESANKFHGLLTLDYYKGAMKYLEARHHNLTYFIFSDDLNWCKLNFDFVSDANYIESNKMDLTPHEELLLISKCKHAIIANSSFSWWGAWLNSHSNKLVIAPNQWFNSNTKQPLNLLPNNWIKL